MAWHRERDADTRIARIFNTYGPRMKLDDGRVVPAFVAQALAGEDLTIYGDGAQTRSFCYVSDLIEGFVLLMASQERYPVNLGNPDELTVREFAEAVRTQSGARCGLRFEPLPQDDPQRRRPDITKARQALGWEPKVGLVEGLRRTLEWFRGRPTPERPR
jgi:dTDP-glucose 4,6-dehydratase